MVKKTVQFVGDAPKPKMTRNATFGLRSPFQLTIPARSEQVVDLGVECDRFMSLLPHGTLFPNKEVVCVPNKSVKVSVFNYSDAPALIEIGDVVVEAVILDSSDFTVE
jgi:dUTPase